MQGELPIQTYQAQVRDWQGTPTVFVNDQPYHFGAVAAACYREELPSLMASDPQTICFLQPPEAAHVGEEPNLDSLGERVNRMIKAHPDALLGCVFHVAASLSWAKNNPDEMTLYDQPMDWLSQMTPGRFPEPSWASQRWREDSSQFMGKLASFLHREFHGRVILYQIGAGKCGENFPVIDPVKHGLWYCGDFSEPMRQYFSQWLSKRYNNDLDRLRAAWGDDRIDFEQVQIPCREARLQSDWFSFRSPCRAQVSDYYRAWSESIEQSVIAWAGAVKQATHNESLTASPMGSVLDCGINADTVQHLMKNSFRQCLASPDLDMLQSPASYILRDLGRGDTSSMVPMGSLRQHGKIWLRDFDSRTSRAMRNVTQDASSMLWQAPTNLWEDEQLLKRDAGYTMLKGGAWWWHEIVRDMYGDANHARIASHIAKIGEALQHVDRRPAAGLGVITDAESNFHLSNSNRLIFAMNYEARRLHWTHAGMASEIYDIQDVPNTAIAKNKVIMVTNAFALSVADADRILAMARKQGATLIWLYAPGVVDESGFNIDKTSRIVGLPIRVVDAEAQPTIRMIESDHPWSQINLSDGRRLTSFGVGSWGKDDAGRRAIGPLFYADVESSKNMQVLGTVEALAKPGLVAYDHEGVRCVYCSAPYMHHALLAAIGMDAGANQLVMPGDLVHASEELVLHQAVTEGDRTLQLSGNREVVCDLFTGDVLGENLRHITMPMKANEVRLLYAGSRDRFNSRILSLFCDAKKQPVMS